MMLEYEKITGKNSIQKITDGKHIVEFEVWDFEYIKWLEKMANMAKGL